MRLDLLDVLRCPFCGTGFLLEDNAALIRHADTVESGVIGCACCAFPIVAGIPILIADDPTRDAMHTLEAGHREEALFMLLDLDESRRAAFRALVGSSSGLTYKSAIEVLSPDAEGTYFIYRFSDPTYVMTEALLDGIARNATPTAGRVLDLCGGTGHMTRLLAAQQPLGGTVLADVFFWKLWLAKQVVVPDAAMVCCDGNNPLPFARDTFSTVVLSDAFPYIWHKRLLAEEMMRLVGDTGTIIMPHLHSSLGENYSAGMTLTPAAYRDLFAPLRPRLFSDRALLTDAIERGAIDLSQSINPEALGDESSCTLVASGDERIFRRYEPRPVAAVTGQLAVNPLYHVVAGEGVLRLTLTYPTVEYEEEFGESRRYLPDTLTLPAPISPERLGDQYEVLRRRRVLLDVPPRYV